jgi:hypothetical protein
VRVLPCKLASKLEEWEFSGLRKLKESGKKYCGVCVYVSYLENAKISSDKILMFKEPLCMTGCCLASTRRL